MIFPIVGMNSEINYSECTQNVPKFSYNIIHDIFFISHYFGIGSDYFYFLRLKFSLLNIKILKKKERQMFRPHMGALFSAINSKINSKFR